MNYLLLISLALTSGVHSPCQCSDVDVLTVRNGHVMAYDYDHGFVLLFGGADDHQVLGDLWAWDGRRWHCLTEEGPPPRTFPGIAYDNYRHQLVLFGGNRVLFGTAKDTNTFLGDMWFWNGLNWSQFKGRTPPPRAEPGMVFDEHRKRIVLFGGHSNLNGKRIRFGDTWEWDGQQWEQKSSTGPSARNGAAMTFDSNRNRVVLFGGSGATGDTWEWDGQQWSRISSAETVGRFNSVMTFDKARNSVFRFGGWTGKKRVGDLWEYDGERWRELAAKGPAGRNHAAMAYDSDRNVIVLFGGHDGERIFGDTWELKDGVWILKRDVKPRMRIDNGH